MTNNLPKERCDGCRVNKPAFQSVFCKKCKKEVVERNRALIGRYLLKVNQKAFKDARGCRKSKGEKLYERLKNEI